MNFLSNSDEFPKESLWDFRENLFRIFEKLHGRTQNMEEISEILERSVDIFLKKFLKEFQNQSPKVFLKNPCGNLEFSRNPRDIFGGIARGTFKELTEEIPEDTSQETPRISGNLY